MRVHIDNVGNVNTHLEGIYSNNTIFKIEISTNQKIPKFELGSGLDSKGYFYNVTIHNEDFTTNHSNVMMYVDIDIYKNYKPMITENPYSLTVYLIPITDTYWNDISEQKSMNFGLTRSLTGSLKT